MKQVADSYSAFLEPVMCRESIYRGRRDAWIDALLGSLGFLGVAV